MKKHFIYLISAIIAVSFVFVSCSEDENGNNDYNENGYYNGGDNGYPPPVDPCKEYAENVAISIQDSANKVQPARDALVVAKTNPLNITNLWMDNFESVWLIALGQDGVPETFTDSLWVHQIIAAHFINHPNDFHPAIQQNIANIKSLFDIANEYRNIQFRLLDKRQDLYRCREENN